MRHKTQTKCLSAIDKDTEFLVPRICIEWATGAAWLRSFCTWVSSPGFQSQPSKV